MKDIVLCHKDQLTNFDIDNLDMFELMQYEQMTKSISKENALQILINNVEGDYSQLSEGLREIAELQDETLKTH